VLCLGRRASGERFEHGELRLRPASSATVGRSGWNAVACRRRRAADLAAGLAGFSVSGTLLATGRIWTPACSPPVARSPAWNPKRAPASRLLPDLLVARYLGHASEAARNWFAALWQVLRPAVIGRAAQTPRIWNT
jgi:urease accessory protein